MPRKIREELCLLWLIAVVVACLGVMSFRACGSMFPDFFSKKKPAEAIAAPDDLTKNPVVVKEEPIGARVEANLLESDSEKEMGEIILSGSGKSRRQGDAKVTEIDKAELEWKPAAGELADVVGEYALCDAKNRDLVESSDENGSKVTRVMQFGMCKGFGRESLNELRARLHREVVAMIESEIEGRLNKTYAEMGHQGGYEVQFDFLIEGVTTRPLMSFVFAASGVDQKWNTENLTDGPINAAVLLESLIDHPEVDAVRLLQNLRFGTYKFTKIADDRSIVLIYFSF